MPAETSSDEILASTWPKSAANPFLCLRFLLLRIEGGQVVARHIGNWSKVSPQARDRD